MPPTIYTIGYAGRTPDELIRILLSAGVTRVVDVRELPLSRRKGFSKTALGEALAESGIEYRHVKALGTPKLFREMYKKGDVAAGAAGFREHLLGDSMTELIELRDSLEDSDERICLLCVENDHEVCHRAVIVEELRTVTDGLKLREL
jgi:uncharacterized protein (DUF488 family)